jgi:hypothetical protein
VLNCAGMKCAFIDVMVQLNKLGIGESAFVLLLLR